MAPRDLRTWLEEVEKIGELRKVEGADWDLEVGTIASLTNDAILVDRIVGYPPGYRILLNMTQSGRRWRLGMNWTSEKSGVALCRAYKEFLQRFEPLPLKWVRSGPILENLQEGNEVNLLRFPAPKLHPEDGGRYLGTTDAVVMKDPHSGRVNLGTYRVQVHDQNTLGIYICGGKDGQLILQEYQNQGKSCPVVILVGIEPAIFEASLVHMEHSEGGEYELAGYLKGEAIEVIQGELTGLPIPAHTEIAIEGEIRPGDMRLEGPFGEWTGYSEPRPAPLIRVRKVLFRDDPILTVQSPSAPSRLPQKGGLSPNIRHAAVAWGQMEKAGVRGIQGVSFFTRGLMVVSIKNMHAGQSRQAAYIATFCHAGAYMGKYTIVVDDEIDPYNLDQVIWALTMRADPQRAIEIAKYCWSDAMDAALPIEERIGDKPVYNSRCIIDACKPVHWGPKVKKSVTYSPELQARIKEKFRDTLFSKDRPQEKEAP